MLDADSLDRSRLQLPNSKHRLILLLCLANLLRYCVRPNSGIIHPNSQVEVQGKPPWQIEAIRSTLTHLVLLQAMKEDPPLDAKCRDKFLVQSVVVDDTQESNLTSLWQQIEKTNKGSIQERKIRVNFLPASGAATNGVASHEDQPPAYTSPTPQFGSPVPASSSDAKSPPTTATESVKQNAVKAAEVTGVAGAAAVVANAVPSNTEDVKAQLAAAREQISSLSQQLQDPQVRQRKMAETQEKVQAVVQQSQESGVPLRITAVLCLVSFLIAYLFF